LLKPARELDVHLRIQLPMRFLKATKIPTAPIAIVPPLASPATSSANMFTTYLEWNPGLADKNHLIRIEHLTYPAV